MMQTDPLHDEREKIYKDCEALDKENELGYISVEDALKIVFKVRKFTFFFMRFKVSLGNLCFLSLRKTFFPYFLNKMLICSKFC